jgi:hypothetical protein
MGRWHVGLVHMRPKSQTLMVGSETSVQGPSKHVVVPSFLSLSGKVALHSWCSEMLYDLFAIVLMQSAWTPPHCPCRLPSTVICSYLCLKGRRQVNKREELCRVKQMREQNEVGFWVGTWSTMWPGYIWSFVHSARTLQCKQWRQWSGMKNWASVTSNAQRII